MHTIITENRCLSVRVQPRPFDRLNPLKLVDLGREGLGAAVQSAVALWVRRRIDEPFCLRSRIYGDGRSGKRRADPLASIGVDVIKLAY
jgi:hypothetical protein